MLGSRTNAKIVTRLIIFWTFPGRRKALEHPYLLCSSEQLESIMLSSFRTQQRLHRATDIATRCSRFHACDCQSDRSLISGLLQLTAQHQVLALLCTCPTSKALSVLAAQCIPTRFRMLPLWTGFTASIRQPAPIWTNVRLFSCTRTSLATPQGGKDTLNDALNAACRAYRENYYQQVTKKKLEEDPEYRAKIRENARKRYDKRKKRMEEDANLRELVLQKRKEA